MDIRPTSNERMIAPSRHFKPGLESQVEIIANAFHMLTLPGDGLNLVTGKRFREVRDQLEPPTPYVGVHVDGEAPRATDVPNPDAPDGRWNPTQFMPRFVFDAAEDAYPVRPDFDGDTSLDNNGPETAGGPAGHYKDGMVGGNQGLSGGFTVTKKGDYTILTYSFYYAHNKAGDYHQNDYSTAQVYLKPGKDGKLAPQYLMTSWHHGGMLTPWSELKKDDQGRPIVGVDLGSHALEVRDSVPAKGLQLRGDGQALLDGKPIGQGIRFDAFQKNIDGARYLDPASPAAKPRISAMTWGEQAINPFLPEVFHDAPPTWLQVVQRGESEVQKVASGLWHKVKGLF